MDVALQSPENNPPPLTYMLRATVVGVFTCTTPLEGTELPDTVIHTNKQVENRPHFLTATLVSTVTLLLRSCHVTTLPTPGNLFVSRGKQKMGFLSEAKEAWHKAVELDPGTANALASLGHLAGASGDVKRVRSSGYSLFRSYDTRQHRWNPFDKVALLSERSGPRANMVLHLYAVPTHIAFHVKTLLEEVTQPLIVAIFFLPFNRTCDHGWALTMGTAG